MKMQSDPRKKVFLIRNIAPNKFGGGETYQIKLGLMLKKNGFEPYVLTASKGLLREASNEGLSVIEVPYIRQQNWSGWWNTLLPIYVIKQIRLKRWYRKLFMELRPSVVNIQSRDEWIAVTKMAKKMGMKVLWTDHMDFRSWVLTNVGVWYKNLPGKWVLRNAKKADKIILISDYENKFLDRTVRKWNLDNVRVIKNGVTDERDKYKDAKRKRDSICYVGRIVDYKGIGELLEAFGAVRKRIPNATLNIYGKEEKTGEYSGGIEKDSGVYFCGMTNEPLKALAENEIFVLPSYREGLSLSLLEAAMMEKKIIASDVDGNPEVVVNGKTGLLVPAKNVEKLAEAMIWMLEHKKEADKMAKKARKRYEENFDFDKIFEEKMLPLYNNEKEKK